MISGHPIFTGLRVVNGTSRIGVLQDSLSSLSKIEKNHMGKKKKRRTRRKKKNKKKKNRRRRRKKIEEEEEATYEQSL